MLPTLTQRFLDWCGRSRARLQTSDVLVWAIVGMTLVIVGGYVYANRQQAELVSITEQAREMRRARQALMEIDSSVLHAIAMASPNGTSAAYFRAVERLSKHGADHFPATVARDGQPTAADKLVAELKQAWTESWGALERGDAGAAERIYGDRQTAPVLTDVVAGMYKALDSLEARYTAVNDSIAFMTSALLVLQILTGLACAYTFRRSARHMLRESKARALAVRAADASREQVLRLFEMADMLQSATDSQDATAVLKATATDLLPGLGGALYVFNNSRDRLVLTASWGVGEPTAHGAHASWRSPQHDDKLPEVISVAQCWALKRGKPHINRPQSQKLCCEHHAGHRHVLELPMVARGEILGLLQIFGSGDVAEEKLGDAKVVGAALADAMSLALSSIQLREKLRGQALRDPLTGLYNRRYMEDTLQRFVGLAEREQRQFSVIMIDLDHFKRLNDQFGHAKGDAVLRDAAAAIIAQLRETDVACRYGGEELIVLLPDCSEEVAAGKAERMRVAIEGLSEPNGAQVSASLGVAAHSASARSGRDLVACADAALYLAKTGGRNRVARAQGRAGDEAAGVSAANDTRPALIGEAAGPGLEAAE